jgi:hypothetical protein
LQQPPLKKTSDEYIKQAHTYGLIKIYCRPAEHFILPETAVKFGLHEGNRKFNTQNKE